MTQEELNKELLEACKCEDFEKIKFLVEQGADVNAKDCSGSSILMWACYKDKSEVVKFLVERGADVNAKNNYKETALWWAYYQVNLEIVKFLVENGANIKDILEYTYYDEFQVREKIVKYLQGLQQ